MDETAEGNMKQWSEGSTVTALSFARAFGERCPNCKAEVASGGEAASGPDEGGVLQCPACGVELQLAVALEEPRIGLWVASVVGLALGAGFDWMVLAFGLAVWALDDTVSAPRADEIWLPLVVPGVVMGTLLLLVLRHRRWFRERPAGQRISMAVLSFVLSGAVAVWFWWCAK
jgi:hypothetical protein